MRTSICVLIFGFWIGIAGPASASAELTSSTIDSSDLQQFEQSYEAWVQSIVQNLIPTQKPTVLIEMRYTQNVERLQTYSDLRTTRHLPGLPEVMDPYLSHPSESPLSALVDRRRIKIIFERVLTPAHEKLLAEVLNNKLKISAAAGDQLVLSTLETPATNSSNHRVWQLGLLLGTVIGGLVFAALLARSRRGRDEETIIALPIPAPAVTQDHPKGFEFNGQDRNAIQRLQQVDSRLTQKTASIVNPTQIILRANPKAIICVLRKESVENIARAIHGTSILFQKTVLSICSSKQRNQIREFSKNSRISKGQTLFAQNLIAAKIHREMRTLTFQAVERYSQAQETLKAGRVELDRIRQALTRPQSDTVAPSGSEKASEVQA